MYVIPVYHPKNLLQWILGTDQLNEGNLVWSVNHEIISIHLRAVNALENILCANNIFSKGY